MIVPGLMRLQYTIFLLGLLFYACGVTWYASPFVAGSDSTGYYNSARLLERGEYRIPSRSIPGLPPSRAPMTPLIYMPLGLNPDGNDGLVPSYPVGVPLHLLLAAKVVGWQGAVRLTVVACILFFVVSIYILARECTLGAGSAFITSAAIGTSALTGSFGLQLLSDIPATSWCCAAGICALRGHRNRYYAIASGLSFSIAVLVRPADVLMVAPLSFALGTNIRRWTLFIVGGLPAAIFLAYYNVRSYGSPFVTGYQGLESAFAVSWVLPTFWHYAKWLGALFTPLCYFGFALPWTKELWRLRAFLISWVIVFFCFYATYSFTHQSWGDLRFILPAAPALLIAALLVLRGQTMAFVATRRMFSKFPQFITLSLLGVLGVLYQSYWLLHLHGISARRATQPAWEAAQWLNAETSPQSIISSMQNSGSLQAYTQFPLLRWDWIFPDSWALIQDQALKQNAPIYSVLNSWEKNDAFRMMPGNWEPVAAFADVEIYKLQSGESKPSP